MPERDGIPDEGRGRARGLFESVARLTAANPRAVLATAGLLTLAFGLAAVFGLEASSGTASLTPRAADAQVASDRIKAQFADDPIVVMVEEDLSRLMLTSELAKLLKLEGCLGGNVPKGATPYGGWNSPCGAIARSGQVQRVYGPATFVNEAANQISAAIGGRLDRAAKTVERAQAKARAEAKARGLSSTAADAAAVAAGIDAQRQVAGQLAKLQVETGLSTLPTIANPDFVSQVAFDSNKGIGQPKARFAYLLPSAGAALVQVRPRVGLSAERRRNLIGLVRNAVGMKQFALADGRYTVTGSPVLAESLSDEVAAAAVPLLLISLVAMAFVLLILFRVRLRLVPLLVAVVAAALVFGAMAILGLPLTVAAVGGVPVLIGLAVDYAVQLQARVLEADDVEEQPGSGAGGDGPTVRAAGLGGPAIAIAAVATMAGFLALLLSPVPMVKGFGLVMIAGVAIALAVAFSVGLAALATAPDASRAAAAAEWIDSAVLELGGLISGWGWWTRMRTFAARASDAITANPARVLACAAAVALLGWAVEGQLSVESDITRLVPRSTPALADVERLQAQTGVAGEADVLVSGEGALTPAALKWMAGYRNGALKRWGYSEEKGCKGASLCPGVAITDLVGANPSAQRIRTTLGQLPDYFKRAVVAPDGKAALLSFGVRLQPLERQQEIFDWLRSAAHDAPPGLTVSVGGLPVVAAEANRSLADPVSRLKVTLAALAAVAIALLLLLRSLRAAAAPLIATAIATGWATLGLWVFGIELNPLSAAFGAVVIAISTEFAVLLSERQRAEAQRGGELGESIERALDTTGRAIVVSGITVVTGFAVLSFSDIRVLRDFGIATVVNLLLALAAVRLTVPAWTRFAGRGAAGE